MTAGHLDANAQLSRNSGAARPRRSSSAEREAVLHALQEHRFNMSRAAVALGVSRATLYRMLQRNGIELAQQFLVRSPELAVLDD